MAQISYYKLDVIRKKLVLDKFGSTRKEIIEKLGKSIYEAILQELPESVVNAFYDAESAYISYILNYRINSSIPYVAPKYFQTSTSFSSWSGGTLNDYIALNESLKGVKFTRASYQIVLPKPVPCTSNIVEDVVLRNVRKNGEMYDLFVELFKLDTEMNALDKKLECLFRSKRFYPNTLKNEFPEAYDILIAKFGQDEKPVKKEPENPNLCDNIENIRATLLSNK